MFKTLNKGNMWKNCPQSFCDEGNIIIGLKQIEESTKTSFYVFLSVVENKKKLSFSFYII